MNKKKISQIVAGLLVATALLVPRMAQAATVAQLQDTVNKAYKLCAADAEKYAYSCEKSAMLNDIKEVAATKGTEAQQKAYIKSKISDADFTAIQKKVDGSYLKAVAGGKIDDATGKPIAGSSYSGKDNCGGVSVSVDVGCSGKGNPIYDYLRGIIIFIGAAIGIAVVISIIVAGIQYSAANGNPQNIAKAKERIVNAVIGLVLYLFLAAILRYLIPQVFS